MYIILKGSCNVHVDLNFDESAQAGALQKASLQPKVAKKKTAPNALSKQHLTRLNSTARLERVSSSMSSHSDSSVRSSNADRAEHKRGRSLLGDQLCPCCCTRRSLIYELQLLHAVHGTSPDLIQKTRPCPRCFAQRSALHLHVVTVQVW